MITTKELQDFYTGKKVLVTGAHGFKGVWLSLLLKELGADVVGVGLLAPDGDLYQMIDPEAQGITMVTADVRDRQLVDIVKDHEPDVVFHLAAQPIVSVGYTDPYLTYSTNVMGTVNFLDGVRALEKKVSVVNVTTDKVYLNVEKEEGYLEDEKLMGEDPYSSSKSCSELVTYSYEKSFFESTVGTPSEKIVSTCRAGNVIGGGDFALNRIVPDLARAVMNVTPVEIRNFNSVRPYEHVLDTVLAYAIVAAEQYINPEVRGAYNIGPNPESLMKTKEITDFFAQRSDLEIIDASANHTFHEALLLSLDSSKFRETFAWAPKWGSKDKMLEETFAWYEAWVYEKDLVQFTKAQIKEFLND